MHLYQDTLRGDHSHPRPNHVPTHPPTCPLVLFAGCAKTRCDHMDTLQLKKKALDAGKALYVTKGSIILQHGVAIFLNVGYDMLSHIINRKI